jgi:peptidoglycan/LPS O-acetylase OafA/YrhL
LGVPVFFLISGYCVYLAAEHSKNAADFIIRRAFRIFPPYWFSLLIVAVVVIVLIIVNGTNSVTVLPKSVLDIFSTLALLTTPFSKVQVTNWVYWTLTYEIFFYFIIWLSLLLPKRYQSLLLILISFVSLLLPIHEHWPLFFIKHWPEFCLGLVIYRLLHNGKKEIWQTATLLLLSVIGLFVIDQMKYYPFASLITAVLIILSNFKPLYKNWLSTLGDYSYSIYLIHVPIGVYLFGYVKQQHYVQTHVWLNVLWDLSLLTLIIVVSKFMYLYIELPSIKMGKKIANVIYRKTAL